MHYDEILKRLESQARPGAAECAAQVGIAPRTKYYGVKIRELRHLARHIGPNLLLAERLWLTPIHDARILATMLVDPRQVTEAQMEHWAAEFDSWDLCDQCCINLFRKTEYAYAKAAKWSHREEVLVKRAAFTLMAMLAVHDKYVPHKQFFPFLPVIQQEATDERDAVKKAVAWSLRKIGLRSPTLRRRALEVAEALQHSPDETARWIADDVLYELSGESIPFRLR